MTNEDAVVVPFTPSHLPHAVQLKEIKEASRLRPALYTLLFSTSDEGIGIWIRVMKASLRKLIKLPSGCVNEKLSDVITYLSWGQFESAFRELPIYNESQQQAAETRYFQGC
jgi:hypothetical protein